jgi:hypothetical protein
MSEGLTGVISYSDEDLKNKKLLRIMLGNFPPKSKADLKAFCSQKLEFEDMFFCFRLPMNIVTRGNSSVEQNVVISSN